MASMKKTRLFKTGRSLAVRLPKAWVEGTTEVILEHQGDSITIRPRPTSLKALAKQCQSLGKTFPDRLPQTETGVRSKPDA